MGRNAHPDPTEQRRIKQENDRISGKMRHWKKSHGIIFDRDDYEVFSKNSLLIKKILPFLDVVQRLQKV